MSLILVLLDIYPARFYNTGDEIDTIYDLACFQPLTWQEQTVATISDVAKRAGVSPVTVSRVINNAANVSPATRENVRRAIKDLGYVPSGVAQSLRSKRTRSLALLVPDITNVFWTTVARGVEDTAQGRGYSVLLCNTDESTAKQQRYLEVVISQRVDGVIIAPCDAEVQNLAGLRQRQTPTVIIDRRVRGWEVDTVRGDSLGGARALVGHLLELGHRRIAVISGPPTTSTAQDRLAGYCLALVEAGLGLDPALVKRGEFRSTSGRRLTHELLAIEPRPTAIFAANNAIAIGVLEALQERGLRTPHDVALVSFDDLPDTSRLFPFLTVIVQPAYDIGLHAAQLLLDRLEGGPDPPPRHVELPARLLIRRSCGYRLQEDGVFCLPLSTAGLPESRPVKPLDPEQKQRALACLAGL